jgi:hypothetical protein
MTTPAEWDADEYDEDDEDEDDIWADSPCSWPVEENS